MEDPERVSRMRVLVVSLLRLGDIVMSTPILQGLRNKFPNAKIDIMINAQFSGVAPLLPHCHKVILFPRQGLQRGLGENSRGVFESFDRLKEFLEEVNKESYDLAINLTHNRLSGFILSQIRAKEVRGLVIQNNGGVSFGSPWFRYLNNSSEKSVDDIFHFIDLFHYGSGPLKGPREIVLNETAAGRESALQEMPSAPYMVIQPLTSDSKKNWGLNNFKKMIEIYQRLGGPLDVMVLGAPAEKKFLDDFVNQLECDRSKVKVVIAGLETALSLLKEASLILTGDTSIKHMACATDAKIIELSLGSSSLQRTGTYKKDSFILQSKEACAPCEHRNPCKFETNICASKLDPMAVAMVCQKVHEMDMASLRTLASEYSDQFEIFKVGFTNAGDWTAYSMAFPLSFEQMKKWIDRSSWRLLLNSSTGPIMPFGTEVSDIQKFLAKAYPEQDLKEFESIFNSLEKNLKVSEEQIENLISGLNFSLKQFDAPGALEGFFDKVQEKSQWAEAEGLGTAWATIRRQVADNTNKFYRVRKIRETLTDMQKKSQIELKLVQSMRTKMAGLI